MKQKPFPAPRIFACAVLAVVAVASQAGAQGATLTMRSTTSAFFGQATEVVLDNGYKLSELDWPLLPLVTVGTALDLRTPAGMHAALEFQAGLPGASGTMTDSDYLNGDNVRTHYSQADNHTERAIFLEGRFGWSLPLSAAAPQPWALEPFVSFQFIQLKWSAQNGYLQYPPETAPPYTPWYASEPTIPVYGTGILYQQDYYIPAIGLQVDMPLLPRLSVSAAFAFAPYVLASDIDNHLFRLIDFYAPFMQGGVMLEPRVTVSFLLGPHATLSLDGRYRHIAGLVGDSYAVGTGVPGYLESIQLAPGVTSAVTTNGESVSLDAGGVTLSLDIRL